MARRHSRKQSRKPKSEPIRPEAEPRAERAVPVPSAEEPTRETYRPERGEVFYEEEQKPFADSLREILEEYRSDSSPSRYAMAVELGEADDWEEYLGPQLEEPEPIYPTDGRAVQDILQASWLETHADEPDVMTYSPARGHHRGLSGSPVREPASTAAVGGYRAEGDQSWKAIVEEYRNYRDPEDDAVRPAASVKRVSAPMTYQDEQSDIRAAEDALPEGIRPLQNRRRERPPEPVSSHLSVEDILAEFHGYKPSAPASPAPFSRLVQTASTEMMSPMRPLLATTSMRE